MSQLRPKTASTLSRASLHLPDSVQSPKSQVLPKTPNSAAPVKSNCPLDDPELGVISQNEHRLKRCLCKFCTCGLHKCPGDEFLDPYPLSMYASHYQTQYQNSPFEKPLRATQPLHRQNIHPMDFLTSYEKDFRPFRVTSEDEMFKTGVGKPSRPQTAGPIAKFLGLSSYHVEYPNWGGSKPYHIKRYYDSVPTHDMKFEGESQYRENYKPVESLTGLTAKAAGMNAHSSLSVHGKAMKLDAKTTAKSMFLPFPKGLAKTISFKRNDRMLSAESVPGMYDTEYRNKYVKQKAFVKNPQDVRSLLAAKAT